MLKLVDFASKLNLGNEFIKSFPFTVRVVIYAGG